MGQHQRACRGSDHLDAVPSGAVLRLDRDPAAKDPVPRFPQDEETRKVARLQSDITRCFLTDSYGLSLMIWSDEQRAIGEQMIVEEHGDVLCMGYARFRERCADTFLSHRDRV